MRTAILIDSRYRNHDPGPGHPERPDRIAVIEDLLHSWRGAPLERVAARRASEAEILSAHGESVLARIRATEGLAHVQIDPDTGTSARSYETALLASGGLLELIDAVATRAFANGFAFLRPPGHHATRDRSMGFCLFNNVAIAAEHLRQAHGLERIAIVDWDVHHGNGTEEIFYADPGVLYVSLHRYPFYPGSGAAGDVGSGPGTGFNVNIPFSAGVGDLGYELAFQHVIEPVLRQFAPQFILVSAGFDAHHRDPLGGMGVTDAGFASMARRLVGLASQVAGGRIAAVLEGGYDLDALRTSSAAVLEELVNPEPPAAKAYPATPAFDPIRKILEPYWTL